MRLLFVVTEDWYFLAHRLPMATAARDAGFEVHVATHVVNGGKDIENLGFTLHPVPFARGRYAPMASLRTVLALRKLQQQIKPAITHHVSAQSILLGSIAAIGCSGARVNALTGLGYLFTSERLPTRIARSIMIRLLRVLVNQNRSILLVENPDDRDVIASIGIALNRIHLVPGSGIDVAKFVPHCEPKGLPVIAFVGRLLEDKGIRTLITAHRLLRQRHFNVELLIAGVPDPANRMSISHDEIEVWAREIGVFCLGYVRDIPKLWARAHIAVLPSWREGLPLSLLEAAACGRAMIASDVPGCREVVRHGETGLLVPANDPAALAEAIQKLCNDSDMRRRLGQAARHLVIKNYSSILVGNMMVGLYHSLLDNADKLRSEP